MLERRTEMMTGYMELLTCVEKEIGPEVDVHNFGEMPLVMQFLALKEGVLLFIRNERNLEC